MVTAAKVAALFRIISDATTATATPIADAHGALSTVTLTIRHAAVTSGVYGWMLGSLGCCGDGRIGVDVEVLLGAGPPFRWQMFGCWPHGVGNYEARRQR